MRWYCFGATVAWALALLVCAEAFVVQPVVVQNLLRAQPVAHRRLLRGHGGGVMGHKCSVQDTDKKEDGVEAESESRIRPMRLSDALKRAREGGWTEKLVRDGLDAAKEMNEAGLWKSTKPNFRRNNQNEVRMLTRGVIQPDSIDTNGEDDMEVLNISFYATLISSMILSTVAGVLVPDIDMPFFKNGDLRFYLVFVIGASPFAFLGLGLSIPGLLQAMLIQIRRLISDEFSDRLARHEAGHFLVGHALGLPIAEYKAKDAILNAVQFFDEDKGGLMGYARRLTREQVDVMCAISMAGVVAETIKYGNGLGGFADLSQLQGFLNRATPSFDDREQQERVRWGAVAAYTILKNNEKALEALVSCMRDGRSVEQCIEVIEEVTREQRLKHDPNNPWNLGGIGLFRPYAIEKM